MLETDNKKNVNNLYRDLPYVKIRYLIHTTAESDKKKYHNPKRCETSNAQETFTNKRTQELTA